MRIARLLLLSLMLLLAPAAAASAASVSIGFSADPTEDKPVAITVSGSSDASRALWVLRTTATSCAATVDGNAGAVELNTSYYGDNAPAGAFSRTYSFTPSDTSTYRLCGYLGSSRGGSPDAQGSNTFRARRTVGSLSVAISPDPTEDKPVTVTVGGQSEVARALWVLRTTATSCAATVDGNAGAVELNTSYYGDNAQAGSFSKSYSFTPSNTSTYRICAYLGQDRGGSSDADSTDAFTPRRTTASVSIASSADPTEDKPLTVTVSGQSEVARALWVLRTTATSCAATVEGNTGAVELNTSYYGDNASAGSFSKSYTFTPADSATYRICAYVGQDRGAESDASSTATVSARATAATVKISAPASARGGDSVAVTISGTSEVARALWVARVDGACPATVSGTDLNTSFYGDSASAGTFTKSYSFVAPTSGTQSICAWVGQGREGPMDATTSSGISYAPPVSLSAEAPASNAYGKPVPLVLKGSTNRRTFLSAFVLSVAARCPTSPYSPTTGAATVIDARPQTVGDINASASFGPAAPGTYRLCAYAAPEEGFRSSGVDAAAETTFVIQEDPAFFLVLLGNEDDEHRDRLALRWRTGPAGTQDTLRVYDREPRSGVQPVLEAVEGDKDELDFSSAGNVRTAKVRRFLGYRALWWQVKRTAAGNRVTYSAARRVRVVPRPLVKAAARARDVRKLGSTSKRPGSVRLTVFSSPLTKVAVRVTRNGRAYTRRSWTESVGGVRSVAFALSCRRTGTFRYTVSMKDPYGTSAVRKGLWSLPASRCAALTRREAAKRAATRQAAARKAAVERRRQRRSSGNSGGGGGESSSGGGGGGGGGSAGCDGDPGATPYPQHPGQRDGDGDGCYGES